MKQGKTACSGMRIRMDRLDGVVLDHLSERLLEPKRLQELLGGYLDQARDGQARAKEKLRQAREARGDVEAKISRLLALVETGAMEPYDPALKDRLVGLRLQKTELEEDIARLQDAQDTSGLSLSTEKLGKLSLEMRKRLAEGPQELLGGGTARRCLGPATKQGIHRRQSPAAYALPVFLRHRSSP